MTVSDTGGVHAEPVTKRPVIFGEVLFDTFADGSSILGGAPFNVAWHLQGFGLNPLFISRIGNDARGAEVQQAMLDWGMDNSALQVDQHYPTGLVRIELNQGQPSYSILTDQAYDFIDRSAVLTAIKKISPSLLYYGSLIRRADESTAALQQIQAMGLLSFVDINLRQPFYSQAVIQSVLSVSHWLKLNDDELREFERYEIVSSKDLKAAAQQLINNYQLKLVIVTLGEAGAFIATDDGIIECPPVSVDKIIDTVGAGDAFSSVMLVGLLKKWSLKDTLSRAIDFAAIICGRRGATCLDQGLYQDCMTRWIAK